ncbi:hypothetical protein NL676_023872 [Syzygium grande]|nr:hypothetical protein NL676_023872 [Syzygium grande]
MSEVASLRSGEGLHALAAADEPTMALGELFATLPTADEGLAQGLRGPTSRGRDLQGTIAGPPRQRQDRACVTVRIAATSDWPSLSVGSCDRLEAVTGDLRKAITTASPVVGATMGRLNRFV